jgi:hypothetical protein
VRQGPGKPTVGDTTTVVYRVSVPPGALVQPRAPTDTTVATLLGAPVVTREGDSVRVALTVTLWSPGRHTLVLPGAVIVRTDGRIDTLPDSRVMLDVASVLPSGRPVASVTPKQARPWVARADRTLLPWALSLILLLAVAAAAIWHWRRRGPLAAIPAARGAPPVDPERLTRWIAAGESRLAVQHLEVALRGRASAVDWLARAEAVRFAPEVHADLAALADEGMRLLAGDSA